MNNNMLTGKSPMELLKLYGGILNELKRQGVVKTRNQPIADYSKWLVAKKLMLQPVANPNEKYDAVDSEGRKYLVRSRRIVDKKMVQFGIIRNIEDKNFDFLVTITYNEEFDIVEAYKIPIKVLAENINFNAYQNGYILNFKHINLDDNRIIDIKDILE